MTITSHHSLLLPPDVADRVSASVRPDQLCDAYLAIAELADARGMQALLEAGRGRLDDLAAANDPLCFAALAYVDYRHTFDEAHEARAKEPARLFRLYSAPATASPLAWSMDDVAALEKALGAGRDGHICCRICMTPHPTLRAFVIAHDGAIHGHDIDLVVFDPETRRLDVSCRFRDQTARYLSGFGRMLFGDSAVFEPAMLVSLAPLTNAPPEPGHGIVHASVLSIDFRLAAPYRAGVTLRGQDSIAIARGDELLGPAPRATCDAVTFALVTRDHKVVRVELRPPDQIRTDYALDPAVRAWLAESGFVRDTVR